MSYAPIVIFIYNRSAELKLMLEMLQNCVGFDQSPIIVFGDGPKRQDQKENVEKARQTAREALGTRAEYRFNSLNKGLANSLIDGVTSVVSEYGSAIVLEDDLYLAPSFLSFVNGALLRYADDEHVFMVSGHNHDIPEFKDKTEAVLLPITTTQGWGTWNRAWQQFDRSAMGSQNLFHSRSLQYRFNLDSSYDYATMLKRQLRGKGNSWGILWYWTVFKKDGLTVFPPQTLVYNIGMNDAGTNGYGRFRKFASSYDPSGKTFSNIVNSFPQAKTDDKDFQDYKNTIWRLNGGYLGYVVDKAKQVKLWLDSIGSSVK